MRARRLREKTKPQSKMENRVEELLRTMFPMFPVYGQYPYYDILKGAYRKYKVDRTLWDHVLLKKGRRLHADYAIPHLGIIIECQGEQHYRPVSRGKGSNAISAFHDQQRRDKDKRAIANEAQYLLVEIKYDETIGVDELWEKLKTYGNGELKHEN